MNARQMADVGRVKCADVKVLFITGYADIALLADGQVAPGTAVLTKPVAMDTVAARICSMIDTKSATKADV